jgi:hypothetical protein
MLVLAHFLVNFVLLGYSSHFRVRLTDQGDADHFGGYADIRVLVKRISLVHRGLVSHSLGTSAQVLCRLS